MSISNLYTHDKYLNKDIPYLISHEIIEYDIQSAGYNISKYYKLLDDNTLDLLGRMEKHKRHVHIGLLCKNNKDYNDKLKEAFKNIRKEFFIANNLVDDDILSIKKDAIFLLKPVFNTEFDNVKFIEKNTYSSYYYINKKEFYSSMSRIDVKGISDDKLEPHREYLLEFMHYIFKMAETSDIKYVIKELVAFIDAYRNKQLDVEYYRELNDECSFRLYDKYNGFDLGISEIKDDSTINISYNFMNYIRPLIEIYM